MEERKNGRHRDTSCKGATQSNARLESRPADDSARFITHAAFCFNHINEAFNLAACFTSCRCVAYLLFVVDENFSPVPRGIPLTPHAPFPSSSNLRHFTLVSTGFSTNTTNPCPFAFVFGLLFSDPSILPRCSLITAARLGPFTPVCSWQRSLSYSATHHYGNILYYRCSPLWSTYRCESTGAKV